MRRMREMLRKGWAAALLGVTAFILGSTCNAADYTHELNDEDMSFAWKIEGDTLAGKLVAETDGWVGVGFNPSKAMQDGNFILGYVKKGEPTVVDHWGDRRNAHKADDKLGGTEDVTLVGGSEEGKITTVEFTIPLNSGDKYDQPIDPNGETIVLLSYGSGRDSFRSKHKYRASFKVNLSTGASEKMK
jgi:hypothetical protein